MASSTLSSSMSFVFPEKYKDNPSTGVSQAMVKSMPLPSISPIGITID